MPTENTTPNEGYPLPHPDNLLSFDVGRLIAALGGIDTSVAALGGEITGKASASHGHAMGDITGLDGALAGKAASGHTHAIGSLSDVTVTGVATKHVLKYSGSGWAASALQIADVVNLKSQLSAMQSTITTMDGGAY